ncbi:MAG: response regulator [Methanosarcinaceae archaeon]|nr:response regulator [Methanosarcinaceae archaeon]
MEPKTISKVLIVDDEPDTIELLQIVLAKNYKTISAYCGREVLNIARSEKPDIIILDIMMPDMTGYEVCKILKNDIETMSIPIILHSALSDSSDREIGMDSGADEYLTKPVDIENLKSTVSTLLDRKLNHNSPLHEEKSGV